MAANKKPKKKTVPRRKKKEDSPQQKLPAAMQEKIDLACGLHSGISAHTIDDVAYVILHKDCLAYGESSDGKRGCAILPLTQSMIVALSELLALCATSLASGMSVEEVHKLLDGYRQLANPGRSEANH